MISLFYPASFLPHKNHHILSDERLLYFCRTANIHIYLTIDNVLTSNHDFASYITFLGRIPHSQSLDFMRSCHGLLFLSSFESLGLPLIEATYFSKPIICPLKSYSLELLGNSAYYYELNNVDGLIMALNSFISSREKISSTLQKSVFSVSDTIYYLSLLIA